MIAIHQYRCIEKTGITKHSILCYLTIRNITSLRGEGAVHFRYILKGLFLGENKQTQNKAENDCKCNKETHSLSLLCSEKLHNVRI